MKIGDKTYSPRRKPGGLDAQLIAATGCNAAEMEAILAGVPLASHVANALLPFLPESDRPSAPELAAEIAVAGVAEVAAAVRALYAPEAAAAPAPGASA